MNKSTKVVLVVFILLTFFPLLPFTFLLNKNLAYYAYKEVSYRTIINNLVGNEKDKKTISLNFLRYLHENLFTPPSSAVIDKDVYNVLIRGIAWCDQRAWALGTFLGKLGIDNRMIMTQNPEGTSSHHTISELFINGKWRFFDPFWGMAIYDNKKELVSFMDICNKPSLFYSCPKMLMLKKIDHYSYKHVKDYYCKKIYYNNPTKPIIWGNPIKSKDFKKKLITKTLDFYLYLFGNYFSHLYQDIYLYFIPNSSSQNLLYFKARNYDLYGRNLKAKEFYEKVINTHPNNDDTQNALFFLGVLLNRDKKFDASIDILDSLINKYRDTKWKAIAYYFIGNNFELLENYELAKQYYWKSIDTYKTYPSYQEYGINIYETNVVEYLYNLLVTFKSYGNK